MIPVSINVSQVFARYPDETDAAGVLARIHEKNPGLPSFVVVRTPSPWLAILSGDNAPAPVVAQVLSRALEASAFWYGLAGNTLAYRLVRYDYGKEAEKSLEPPEIFQPDATFPLPAYRDAEQELYLRLRQAGIPAEYIYLFSEEVGAGTNPGRTDALTVRGGRAEAFRHRVPRRGTDTARTLFDLYREGEQVVYDRLNLLGTFDKDRALLLFQTLQSVCLRRTMPPGWRMCFQAASARDPSLGRQLARVYPRGRFSFDFEAAGA